MRKLFLSLLLGLSGCTVTLPNARVCTVAGTMSAGANCAYMNTPEIEQLDLDQWMAFLEPNAETQKSGALCISDKDFRDIKTALEQACSKMGTACTKDTKKNLAQVSAKIDLIQGKR